MPLSQEPEDQSGKGAWRLSFLIGVTVAVVVILQYPLQSTFPIGGDAARIIFRAESIIEAFSQSSTEGLQALRHNSNYALSILLLTASKIFPGDWPVKWIWLTALGHLAAALACGSVVWRLGYKHATGWAIAAWAIAGLAFTRHVEDATLAQLFSFPLLLLMLNEWWNKKRLLGAALLVATYLLHPLSGVIGAMLVAWIETLNILTERPRHIGRSTLILALVSSIVVLVAVNFTDRMLPIIIQHPSSEEGISLHDTLRSPIGPFVVLAPLGLIALWRDKKSAAPWLTLLLFVSVLLVGHPRWLDASVFLERFRSYFALVIALLGAIGLAEALSRIFSKSRVAPLVFGTLLLVSLGLQTWDRNAAVFAFYESDMEYERLHVTEREAIAWMAEHLPAGSLVVSTKANRHSEWIPVLTDHRWTGLPESDPLFAASGPELANYIAAHDYQYLVFFTSRENPADLLTEPLSSFTTLYSNEGSLLLDLTSYEH